MQPPGPSKLFVLTFGQGTGRSQRDPGGKGIAVLGIYPEVFDEAPFHFHRHSGEDEIDIRSCGKYVLVVVIPHEDFDFPLPASRERVDVRSRPNPGANNLLGGQGG